MGYFFRLLGVSVPGGVLLWIQRRLPENQALRPTRLALGGKIDGFPSHGGTLLRGGVAQLSSLTNKKRGRAGAVERSALLMRQPWIVMAHAGSNPVGPAFAMRQAQRGCQVWGILVTTVSPWVQVPASPTEFASTFAWSGSAWQAR